MHVHERKLAGHPFRLFRNPRVLGVSETVRVATPAEPRGEKKLFFVQILGGEKLLKFVEKCQWKTLKRPERG